MAEYITKLRTENGDLPIAYDSLYGKPTPVVPSASAITGQFADAKAVYTQIDNINKRITEIQGGDDLAGITVNGQSFVDGKLTLIPSHIGAATEEHNHKMSDVTEGVLPITQGGTNASTGSEGLKNLLASGPMILSSNQYGSKIQFEALKEAGTATTGQIFFVKV